MDSKTIRQKIVVSATPDEVYDAYMDAKKHSAFTGSEATSVPRVGGEFTSWDGYIKGKNIELVKGKKIVQEWITTEWPEGFPASKLELTLAAVKAGTQITVVHSGVPADQADDIEQGWTDYYWEPMKDYFRKDRR